MIEKQKQCFNYKPEKCTDKKCFKCNLYKTATYINYETGESEILEPNKTIHIDKPGMVCFKYLWIDEINGNDEIGDGTYEKPFKTRKKLIENLTPSERKDILLQPRIIK